MKIALCLYGKSFGYNSSGQDQSYIPALNYLKKNIFNSNVDIYFHTWNINLSSSQKLISDFNPKSYIIEDQIDFRVPYLDFSPSYGDRKFIYDKLFSIYSKTYSLKSVISLIEPVYDFILITRFDTVFYKSFNFNILFPENFYVSHWNLLPLNWGLNDAWFISGFDNIKNFSYLYDKLDTYYSPNSSFLDFCDNHKLFNQSIFSGHAPWMYRLTEMNFQKKIYAYGLEYETWGLSRRLNIFGNPWGYPTVDYCLPVNVALNNSKHIFSYKKYIKYIFTRIIFIFLKFTNKFK